VPERRAIRGGMVSRSRQNDDGDDDSHGEQNPDDYREVLSPGSQVPTHGRQATPQFRRRQCTRLAERPLT